MAFNGVGVYKTLLPPKYPAVAGETITAEYFNNVIDDIATALSQCLTRDGQSTVTQNISMGSKKLTNLAKGTAGTDAVRRDQVILVTGGTITQTSTTTSDVGLFNVNRTTSHTGGTPGWVAAGIKAKSVVNAGVTNSEWAILGEADNSSAAPVVGVYGQANRMVAGAGNCWGGCFEFRDKSNAADPAYGGIGIEVDCFANGTDANLKRVGVLVVGGKGVDAGTRPRIWCGILIGPQDNDTSNCEYGNGISLTGDMVTGISVSNSGVWGLKFSGTKTVGIDFTGSTQTQACIRLDKTQYMSFDINNNWRLWEDNGGQDVYLNFQGNERFGFHANGTSGNTALKLEGTQVLGLRKTGWTAATGTASRSTFDPATINLESLAQRVKALIDDLISHGLIGA